jgi:WD40 repeat protein
MLANQLIDVPIKQFVASTNKKILLIISRDELDLVTHVIKATQSLGHSAEATDINVSDLVKKSYKSYVKDIDILILYGFTVNNALENFYEKFHLRNTSAKVIFIYQALLLHPSLDPSLYFAPLDSDRLQRHLITCCRIASIPARSISLTESVMASSSPKINVAGLLQFELNHYLNKKLMTNDQNMMMMLANRVIRDDNFKKKLFDIIIASRTNEKIQIFAANAITALCYANVSFSGMDLSYIRVPGADLSCVILEGVDLRSADLTDVNLQNSSMRFSNLSNCIMQNVRLFELPIILCENEQKKIKYIILNELLISYGDYIVSVIEMKSFSTKFVFKEHKNKIINVIYSVDYQLLVSADDAGYIIIRCLTAGQVLHRFKVESGCAETIRLSQFSSIGAVLISGGLDKNLTFWRLDTGEAFESISGFKESIYKIKFIGNSSLIMVITISEDLKRKQLNIFDADTGEIFQYGLTAADELLKDGQPRSKKSQLSTRFAESLITRVKRSTTNEFRNQIVLAKDHSMVAICYEDNEDLIHFFNLSSKTIFSFKSEEPTYHHTFSQNNLYFVSCGQTTIYLYDICNKVLLPIPSGHTAMINDVTFSPDNKLLATCSDDATIRIYNVISKELELALTGHNGAINKIKFHPSSCIIASIGDDNTVRFWDLNNAQLRHHINNTNEQSVIKVLSIFRDRNLIVTGSEDGILRIWDLSTGKIKAKMIGHEDWINWLAITNDSNFIISASRDHTVRKWDIRTGKQCYRLEHHSKAILSFEISPDQKLLAICSGDHTISICNLEDGALIQRLEGHSDIIWDIAFEPDGQYLISGGVDGSFRRWNILNGKEVSCCNLTKVASINERIICVAFNSLNNRAIIGSRSGGLFIFEPPYQLDNCIQFSLSDRITRITFSHNLNYFAVTGGRDLWLFDATNNEVLCSWKAKSWLCSPCFSDNDHLLAVASTSFIMIFSTVAPRIELAVLPCVREISCLEFESNDCLVAATTTGTLIKWHNKVVDDFTIWKIVWNMCPTFNCDNAIVDNIQISDSNKSLLRQYGAVTMNEFLEKAADDALKRQNLLEAISRYESYIKHSLEIGNTKIISASHNLACCYHVYALINNNSDYLKKAELMFKKAIELVQKDDIQAVLVEYAIFLIKYNRFKDALQFLEIINNSTHTVKSSLSYTKLELCTLPNDLQEEVSFFGTISLDVVSCARYLTVLALIGCTDMQAAFKNLDAFYTQVTHEEIEPVHLYYSLAGMLFQQTNQIPQAAKCYIKAVRFCYEYELARERYRNCCAILASSNYVDPDGEIDLSGEVSLKITQCGISFLTSYIKAMLSSKTSGVKEMQTNPENIFERTVTNLLKEDADKLSSVELASENITYNQHQFFKQDNKVPKTSRSLEQYKDSSTDEAIFENEEDMQLAILKSYERST